MLAMLEARSVALVGASPKPGSFGARLVTETRRSTCPLDVHLVNPRYDEVLGRPCLPTLDDIAAPVDLVLFGVGDQHVEEQLSVAAARGDRAGVIFGSLFADGQRERIAKTAREAGMALCGGGCMGFVNLEHGLFAVGYQEPDPVPRGSVALVTHSGSVFSAMLRNDRGIGYTLAVSSGQELVTTTADYLDYALSLPATRVVALVLETMRNAEAMREALARAAEQDVAVVALTVGTSPRGRAMVAAHSQALAGDDGAWEALFDAFGVRRVGDLDEMADTLEIFSSARRARPGGAGSGIATVHDSGAERALVVDVALETGVAFAHIAPATVARLEDLIEPGLEATNPLDVWGTGAGTRELFGECLRALGDDAAVRAVAFAIDLVPEPDGDDAYPLAVLDAVDATDKPVVVLTNMRSSLDRAAATHLRAGGVPVLEGTRSGLRALRHLLDAGDAPRRARAELAADEPRRSRWRATVEKGHLTGTQALALLDDYGITTADSRDVATRSDALDAARLLGFPVVLKTNEPGIEHKSDVGGVVLGVADEAGLTAAYDDLATRFGPLVLVSSMVPAGVELALGIVDDPLLGPLVVVAAGGVLVEVLHDRAVLLPTGDRERARSALDRLSIRPVLDGVRGAPPVAIESVVDALVGISQLAVELGPALSALDVNPLVCTPDGAVAVDALVLGSAS
jgi:acetate---CoA ligase (ADP-forming)